MRVYVINLDRHTQRLARMRDLLRGVDFERIAAVEAATAGGPEHRHKLPLRFEDMTRFERACAASHALAWNKLLESGASHACILEDGTKLTSLSLTWDFSSRKKTCLGWITSFQTWRI